METQESITRWCEETFGDVTDDVRLATRANEEMAELLRALSDGNMAKAPEEAADVVIVLCRLATRCGVTLSFANDHGGDVHPLEWAALASLSLTRAVLALAPKALRHPEFVAGMVRQCVDDIGRLAGALGCDLRAEIESKMRRNRARAWNRDGTGMGYHIKEPAAADQRPLSLDDKRKAVFRVWELHPEWVADEPQQTLSSRLSEMADLMCLSEATVRTLRKHFLAVQAQKGGG